MSEEPIEPRKIVKFDFELLREQLDAMRILCGEKDSLSVGIKANGNMMMYFQSKKAEVDYATAGVLHIAPEFANERTEKQITQFRESCNLGNAKKG